MLSESQTVKQHSNNCYENELNPFYPCLVDLFFKDPNWVVYFVTSFRCHRVYLLNQRTWKIFVTAEEVRTSISMYSVNTLKIKRTVHSKVNGFTFKVSWRSSQSSKLIGIS